MRYEQQQEKYFPFMEKFKYNHNGFKICAGIIRRIESVGLY